MIHQILYDMMQINEADTARQCHALKVYALAKCIAGKENIDTKTQRIVEIAAVLHDIAIQRCEEKYNNCAGKLQEKEGPAVAKPILTKYLNDQDMITRVLYLITHHHTYEPIDNIDHQILIEADLLVNVEEGDITMCSFETMYKKYFRTNTGKSLAKAMFGIS